MAETRIDVNDFYTRRIRDYALADQDTRGLNMAHWLACYADEFAKGRFDEHSARMIANMALVDAGLARLEEEGGA